MTVLSCRGAQCLFAALAMLLVCAQASAQTLPAIGRADWSLGAQLEQWQLPAGESMGLTRLMLRRELGRYLSAGVDSYAAVRGSRGGFITLGVGGEARYPLGEALSLEAGLSVAAGGGRGGYELAGGGLMLREALGLSYRLGYTDAVTVGASRVDFPNGGRITSTQLYVGYRHGFSSLYVPVEPTAALTLDLSAAEASPQQVGAYVQWLSADSGAHLGAGGPQQNLGLVGASWRIAMGDGLFARIEAAGAASGANSGYMQILGAVGYRRSLSEHLALEGSAAIGAGGGGDVDSGGGLLLQAAVGVELRVTRRDVLTLEATRLKAASGSFGARGLTLRAAHGFGPSEDAPAGTPREPVAHTVRIRLVDQQYRGTSTAWSSRPNREFGTLGVQADYFVSPYFFLTGQGLAAYSGRNGAYMIGLVGGGGRLPLSQHVHAQLEALAGAAGGGGVEVGAGVVGQLNASLGYQAASGLGLQLSIGRLQARRGGFAANVAGVSFTYQTDLFAFSDRSAD